MRWPVAWKDPALVDLLHEAGIDYLITDVDTVRARAVEKGLQVSSRDQLPPDIQLIDGQWPGVGGGGSISAGPTGVPWVDSNGWHILLSAAFHPDRTIWVDAAPPAKFRSFSGAYLLAVADPAAYGARWIINLDGQLAEGIASRASAAMEIWNKIGAATRFFALHRAWAEYAPAAVVGVISDFSGTNEGFSHELLNLLARAGAQYRVIPKDRPTPQSFDNLRAVIYADTQPPDARLRQQVRAFVENGGMLIASPNWGETPGKSAKPDDEGPSFAVRTFGKGRIALAKQPPEDPYQWANDSVVLVSHRYDMVRIWNGGATGSYYAISADGKKAVVHVMFYFGFGPDAASIRVAGRFRTARALTPDGPVEKIETIDQKDGIEVHLPQIPPYVAIELEA
jgi:hypothetical protein